MLRPQDALDAWPAAGPLRPADNGNINQTWICGAPPSAVLQWVNPIFSPLIQEDIAAVTAHLAAKGLKTPSLLRTQEGGLSHPDPDGGCWRLMTFIPGRTLHRAHTAEVARAAGAMLGTFHAALSDGVITFQAPSRDIHNTPARMAELQQALDTQRGHALYDEAARLGEALLQSWAVWQAAWGDPTALPSRICHGDPKLSNLRFANNQDTAVCMLDLDTVGPGTLSAELGDAWRSWCNPGGEDDPTRSRFDLTAFEVSAQGYLSTAPSMTSAERESLAPGVERICLELASRFCADALHNSYFRENRSRWPEIGRHNLLRAEGQRRLAAAAHQALPRCQEIILGAR
ncbi:MAG: aminoglycoside phosphotransferase family protein [Myxococcota bacterium]